MRISFLFALLFAAAVWAQAPAAKPDPMAAAAAAAKAAVEGSKPPAANAGQAAAPVQVGSQTIPLASVQSILVMPPGQVVATIDGSKVTAGDLQTVLRAYPPQAQQAALKDRRQFLEQYGVMRRLYAEAQKARLDQQSPWKEQLDYIRMQMLTQARISEKFNEMQVPSEEVKKSYEANQDRFMQARVKAIYIPFSSAPVSQADGKGKKILTEEEAKAKAQDLLKQIRGGADFVKLVKENSGDPTSVAKDGDFGTFKKSDQISGAVKSAIFAAKAGEVTEPVRQPNGFYLFRVEELGPQPFAEAQVTITNELKDVQFRAWLNSVQKSVDIKEEGIEMTLEATQPSSPAKPAPAQTPKPKD
jgi:peptidyl-prolyl cis-trans isomerase C